MNKKALGFIGCGCGCLIISAILIIVVVACIIAYNYNSNMVINSPPIKIRIDQKPLKPIDRRPIEKITSVPMDRYLKLEEINDILQAWAKEVPQFTALDSIGKTVKDTNILCLRITQHDVKLQEKKNILIHSCIHGNERIAASCCMGFMEHILREYGKDEMTTWLLENRNIYFIPVLSVDSYVERQRHVEGVDPNRSYPCPENPDKVSPMPCALVEKFCNQIQFSGVISGHSFGRVFLYPRFGADNDQQSIKQLAQDMASKSNYNARCIGGGYPSRQPDSRGYEIDWYYWKAGAVSILTEFGTGSHDMDTKQLLPEMQRNIEAWKLFIKQAPEIELADNRTPSKPITNLDVWGEEEE